MTFNYDTWIRYFSVISWKLCVASISGMFYAMFIFPNSVELSRWCACTSIPAACCLACPGHTHLEQESISSIASSPSCHLVNVCRIIAYKILDVTVHLYMHPQVLKIGQLIKTRKCMWTWITSRVEFYCICINNLSHLKGHQTITLIFKVYAFICMANAHRTAWMAYCLCLETVIKETWL